MGEPSNRAVALVSGGLDSVVSLAQADRELEVRLVLFADYGQRAADRERSAVMAAVDFYGHPFREVDLRWLGELAPEGMRRSGDADAPVPALDTLAAVWIPNRNGVLLNVAAAFAERYACGTVVTGFNAEEAREFPDNGAGYVENVNRGLADSTSNAVRVVSFTQHLDKPGILELGVALGAPLSNIWSCYHAGERMCGRCASCLRLRQALGRLEPSLRPPLVFEPA